MDNKTRAEKIVSRLVTERCSGDGDYTRLTDLITSQIDEAVREAVDEEYKTNQEHICCRCGQRKCYAEGFAAAREKAAGIAEADKMHGFHIAQQIRKMEAFAQPVDLKSSFEFIGKLNNAFGQAYEKRKDNK